MVNEDFVTDLASELVNNHARFESFGWFDRPEDCERWTIIYTHNRDSGLLDLSNASVIDAALEPFEGSDARQESHNHWACGWIDGWAIRVYAPDGTITPAFRAYAALKARLDDYPFLDEDDYSRREWEAALEAIEREAPDTLGPLNTDAVFSWLWEHEQGEVENQDDQGACPSREAIERALIATGQGFYCHDCDAVVQRGERSEHHSC